MGQLAEGLLSLSGWAALALLFALPVLLLLAACTGLQPAVTLSSSSRRLRGRG